MVIPEQNKPNRADLMLGSVSVETRPSVDLLCSAEPRSRPSTLLLPETEPRRATYTPRRVRAVLNLGSIGSFAGLHPAGVAHLFFGHSARVGQIVNSAGRTMLQEVPKSAVAWVCVLVRPPVVHDHVEQ